MIVCPKCGRQLNDGAKFCPGCGTAIAPAAPAPAPAPAPTYAPAAPAPAPAYRAPAPAPAPAPVPAPAKKGFPKKALLFGGIGVAAVAAIVILCVLIFSGGGGKKPSYALYVKDKEIFFSDLGGDPWQVTSRLVDRDGVDNADLEEAIDELSDYTTVSEDGKYIFFPDKYSGGDFNLYYKELDADAEAEKIDSSVSRYSVSSSGKLVTYMKDRNLYQYEVGEDKEKIASDIRYFRVSDDGGRIVYRDQDGNLYFKERGEDKIKIASEASIEHIDEEFKTIYYTKDDALFRQELKEDSEKEKIATDVDWVLKIYDSGDFYYQKSEKPESSEEEAEYYYDSSYSLCYYDGEETTVIAEAEDYNGWCGYALDAPVIAYTVKDGDDAELFIAVKGNAAKVNVEDAKNIEIAINDAGTLAYFVDDVNDKDEGTLYRMEISDEPGKPESFDEDVYADGPCGFTNDDEFLYFKDYKDSKGEMYINGKKVDDDVSTRSVGLSEDRTKLYYYVDYNKGTGTLKVYDGEAVKIADDVYDYAVLPNGHVLYLYDYSTKSYTGELYDWDGGDAEKIDEDVVCLIPYYYN